ncbi:uncharacterized protein A4U43_C06F7760 [Asparagus officinalis]|uniref:Uncharacterized protein n=1 Tax=Asparagus officinalis TaxID=4686 RepID=A0A5P1EK92_ASPOF|nr:uncharacterized protein A4U43_C06F7760 [Asparagus officinalis]
MHYRGQTCRSSRAGENCGAKKPPMSAGRCEKVEPALMYSYRLRVPVTWAVRFVGVAAAAGELGHDRGRCERATGWIAAGRWGGALGGWEWWHNPRKPRAVRNGNLNAAGLTPVSLQKAHSFKFPLREERSPKEISVSLQKAHSFKFPLREERSPKEISPFKIRRGISSSSAALFSVLHSRALHCSF